MGIIPKALKNIGTKNVGRPPKKKEEVIQDVPDYNEEPIGAKPKLPKEEIDVPKPPETDQDIEELKIMYNLLAKSENLNLYVNVVQGQKEFELLKKIEEELKE